MGLSGGSETCFVCRREAGAAASSEPGKRNLPGSSGKSGACFVCRTRKRFCCDFRAEAELVSFSARRRGVPPPRAGGRRPSAQGVFYEGKRFPPMLRRTAALARPLRNAKLFRAFSGRNMKRGVFRTCRYGTRNALPLSGPGRNARCALRIEGRTVCPCGVCRAFAAFCPKAGDQSAEASPFCASSDACEGRSVKMISARESSSRISSSTPGSTITPERGFLMLSTRVVMTA